MATKDRLIRIPKREGGYVVVDPNRFRGGMAQEVRRVARAENAKEIQVVDIKDSQQLESKSSNQEIPYNNESWKLSNEDAAIIIEMMNNPRNPSKALLSMFD